MNNKIGCKVLIDGTWKRGTLEWVTEKSPSLKEVIDTEFGWTSNEMQFSQQSLTTSNEIKFDEEYLGISPNKKEAISKEAPSHEEPSLTPVQGARLKAAAFYQRLYFWGMVIGFVGGGWLSPYVKGAVWHLGQFLVSLK